jgi:hypothetical protein
MSLITLFSQLFPMFLLKRLCRYHFCSMPPMIHPLLHVQIVNTTKGGQGATTLR